VSSSISAARSSAGSPATASEPALGPAKPDPWGDRRQRARGLGWEHLHVAVVDASRLASTELLADERGTTSAAFLTRAAAWFAGLGVRIERVMTDNASAYTTAAPSGPCWPILAPSSDHPGLPSRTNGKAELFIQTALREWLDAKPYPSAAHRADDMPAWLHWYDHHRPHAGIHASTPASRLNNLLGDDSESGIRIDGIDEGFTTGGCCDSSWLLG
jgi:hypothetical protein